jgi:hypothetical protein
MVGRGKEAVVSVCTAIHIFLRVALEEKKNIIQMLCSLYLPPSTPRVVGEFCSVFALKLMWTTSNLWMEKMKESR